MVHVAGEVRRPGVYRVPHGARVLAAVERAGGPTAGADLTLLNLAAPLQDGQQVIVPARAPAGAAGVPAASGPVSLSSASAEQLEELDGIGPALAARIVEWRTAHGGFAAVDQLAEVPGIGPGRLEALRDRGIPLRDHPVTERDPPPARGQLQAVRLLRPRMPSSTSPFTRPAVLQRKFSLEVADVTAVCSVAIGAVSALASVPPMFLSRVASWVLRPVTLMPPSRVSSRPMSVGAPPGRRRRCRPAWRPWRSCSRSRRGAGS